MGYRETIKKGTFMEKEEQDINQRPKNDETNDHDKVVVEKDFDQQIDDLLTKNSDNPDYQLLKQKIDQQMDLIADLNEKILYQVADNRNMLNRREEIERKLRKYGARKLGELIVPDIDLFKKVLATSENHASEEVKNYLKGFEMISAKLDHSLAEAGIKEVKIAVGDDFDPKIMEAVEQVESTTIDSGKVAQTISNAYLIHDEVLLHGKVKVAK